MDKGDCFLMGALRGRTKHLWVIITDPAKFGGSAVIVNLSTDALRSGGECFLAAGEHPWLIQPQSWACFKDAMLMTASGWNDIQTGINMGFIIPTDRMPADSVEKLIAAARTSRFLSPVLLPYLD
jgi:hypothetical protein